MQNVWTQKDAAPQPDRRFGRFAAAAGLSNLGDGIAVVAWAWTASLLTRDPFWIAALPAALRMPWVLFSLPAGILADRLDRRRLIVACDAVRAGAYLLIGAAVSISLPWEDAASQGVGDPPLYSTLVCLGLVIGCAEVVRDTTAQSMLPALVPRNGLERANGILGSVEVTGNEMAGPALGAVLIALFLPAPFLLIAAALLCSAVLTASLPGGFRVASGTRTPSHWTAELIPCARFVFGHPMLRTLVIVTGIWNFFAEMALIALVLHVQENLQVGAPAYGLILATGALGGMLGGVFMAPILGRFTRGTLGQWMGLSSAPVFALIAFAPGPVALSALMFMFSLSCIIWNTVSLSYRQRVVPDEIRGRVNSIYRLFSWGMMPLGLLASGLVVTLAQTVVSRDAALLAPFLVAAAGMFGLSVVTWRQIGRGFNAQ